MTDTGHDSLHTQTLSHTHKKRAVTHNAKSQF